MKTKILFAFLLLFLNKIYSQTDVFRLLDLPKGYPLWSQARNYNSSCNPCYNELAPTTTDIKDCKCGHKWIGCGSVAMGQIMYYWEWPYSYNWNIIPAYLQESTPNNSANELQTLLYDCAQNMDMNYHCSGSWATTNNVLNAFHNMGYNSSTILKKNNWSWNTWEKIIKTEIDVGRIVLIRGGEVVDWSDWGNVHYFVVDGYDREHPNKFHFNLGWGDNIYTTTDYTTGVSDLTFGDDDYTEEQQIIIGISPTCYNSYPHDITNVPYSQVFSNKSETAFNSIFLPSLNNTLSVEDNGDLILTAGNKIILKQGFKAKSGSHFLARIRNINGCDCGGNISVSSWTNFFSPFNNDGYNDNLCIPVSNANSFTIQVFNRDGLKLFEDAGIVSNNLPCVWNGQGLYNSGYFSPHGSDYIVTTVLVILRFFNNCGQKIENAYWVTAIIPRLSDKSITNNKNYYISNINLIKPKVYPNPTKGILYIDFNNNNISYTIQSLLGSTLIKKEMIDNKIDISKLPSGVYILLLQVDNKEYNYKIIKE